MGNYELPNCNATFEGYIKNIHYSVKKGFKSTSLFKAVVSNNIERVSELIKLGADINARDRSGYPPLILAIRYGEMDIVRLLLSSGANIEDGGTDIDRWTPLMWGVIWGKLSMIKLLISFGADVDATNKDGMTAREMARLEADSASTGLNDQERLSEISSFLSNL